MRYVTAWCDFGDDDPMIIAVEADNPIQALVKVVREAMSSEMTPSLEEFLEEFLGKYPHALTNSQFIEAYGEFIWGPELGSHRTLSIPIHVDALQYS